MGKIWKNLKANLRRERLLTIANIFVMTITFLLLGTLIFIISGSQTALRYLEEQAQITVFFKDDFPEENILTFKSQIEGDQRISGVKYVSKNDAFEIFSQLNKDEPVLLENISPNILPASLEVKALNIGDLDTLADEFSTVDGVEEVRFFEDIIERFKFWSNVIYIIGFVLVGVFAIISYAVIMATVRATIHSKGIELEIMKLVGASNSYVKNPLVYQGIFLGVVSSTIAGVAMILMGAIMKFNNMFEQGLTFGFLPRLYVQPFVFSLILFIVLVLSGCFLGLLGSYTAVKRYLKY
ncbi:FtsX-like permease family protein [candidate division WWE3 bacterium]|uniref:Cell division protein FtsX n=1 Tax=candidate division WWE3 bacterium TaxID=2053526 RepID=A0A3A4ZCL3_UNCKA|nr:MAG: FtsX-like permease family protein [candidate division WWE3 bacterium]